MINQFTVNDVITNKKLTDTQARIVMFILNKPAGFKIEIKELEKFLRCGRNARQRALKGLAELGYIKLTRLKRNNGQIAGTCWIKNDIENQQDG